MRWKLRWDPAYDAVLQELRGHDAPLIDIGCGIGLLAFFLRENGFAAPILGIDFDERKIDAARKAATRYRGIRFETADARDALPDGHNIVMLDVLQYLDTPSQHQTLANIARAIPQNGIAVIRQGVRDHSWRYRLTATVDALGRAGRWMKAEDLNYPRKEEITSVFKGFEHEVRQLWGRMPYNNYLFVFRRSA